MLPRFTTVNFTDGRTGDAILFGNVLLIHTLGQEFMNIANLIVSENSLMATFALVVVLEVLFACDVLEISRAIV